MAWFRDRGVTIGADAHSFQSKGNWSKATLGMLQMAIDSRFPLSQRLFEDVSKGGDRHAFELLQFLENQGCPVHHESGSRPSIFVSFSRFFLKRWKVSG